MTTEQTQETQETTSQPFNDEISQAQTELDTEQGLSPDATPGQPLTEDRVVQLIQAQTSQIGQQISGLQGLIDRGLNSVRQDTTTWAQQQIGDLKSDLGRQAYLNSLDEDQRQLVAPLLGEIDRVRQPEQPNGPVQTEQPPAANPEQQQWEQVRGIVRSFGLDPTDPNVQYAALTNPALTTQQRQDQFFQSLREAAAKQGATTAQPAAQPQQPAAQPTTSPPVEGAGRSGSGFRTGDDVMNAYIANQITKERKDELMKSHTDWGT